MQQLGKLLRHTFSKEAVADGADQTIGAEDASQHSRQRVPPLSAPLQQSRQAELPNDYLNHEEYNADDPFKGPFKVSVRTPERGKTSSRHAATAAGHVRACSADAASTRGQLGEGTQLNEGAEDGIDDMLGEEEAEEGEQEDFTVKPFDARAAHEKFIWRALQGLMATEENTEIVAEGEKRLKWADEDGGELSNVQYFDRNAEPATVFRLMLAADARAENALAGTKPAMGRDEIVQHFGPLLAQIQGSILEVFPVKLMRNGETRTIVIAGRGALRQRVGVAIVWMGGLIKHLKMVGDPTGDFLEDPPMLAGKEGEDPLPSPYEDEYGTPRSQEAELFVLSPPYLVSRPRTFPTPTLEVQVISAHHLKSSATLPRPLNPYVKLVLGNTQVRTSVQTKTKNPIWGGQDRHSSFLFTAEDPNAMLCVIVGDWKIGANVWIARLAIPLASIEVSEPKGEGVLREFDLRLRVSRFAKHVEKEGEGNARLVMRLKYVFDERWWTLKELKARDALMERVEERRERRPLVGGHGRDNSCFLT